MLLHPPSLAALQGMLTHAVLCSTAHGMHLSLRPLQVQYCTACGRTAAGSTFAESLAVMAVAPPS
jgi:hypothetical protein